MRVVCGVGLVVWRTGEEQVRPLMGFPGKTLQRYSVKLSIVEGYSRNNDLVYQLVRIMDL